MHGRDNRTRIYVACRLALERILICFNMLAGPDCSGKCAIGPEKHGLGLENRKFASSLVESDDNRGVARGWPPIFRSKSGRFSRPWWTEPAGQAAMSRNFRSKAESDTRQQPSSRNSPIFPHPHAIIPVITCKGISWLAIGATADESRRHGHQTDDFHIRRATERGQNPATGCQRNRCRRRSASADVGRRTRIAPSRHSRRKPRPRPPCVPTKPTGRIFPTGAPRMGSSPFRRRLSRQSRRQPRPHDHRKAAVGTGQMHRFNDLAWNPAHRDIQSPLHGVLCSRGRPAQKAPL